MILFAATDIALQTFFRMSRMREGAKLVGLSPWDRVPDETYRRAGERAKALLANNGAKKVNLTSDRVTFETPRNHKVQVIENLITVEEVNRNV